MNLRLPNLFSRVLPGGGLAAPKRSEGGSVLILVLWISIGLVSIALYFAQAMTFELRASDNRACGLAAEQAIEGAARYVGYVLSNFATNGAMPDPGRYAAGAVAVGDAHFWLIGRDPSATLSAEPFFGLVDEASKLNLNYADTNALAYLPNMSLDFATAIADWRNTNGIGTYPMNYSALGYADKNSPLETVDELRLVYGSSLELLAGDDVNRNGVLDAGETDLGGNNTLDAGLFEYTTVYSRQPNFHSDGSSLTNVNSQPMLRSLLQTRFGSGRAQQIISRTTANNNTMRNLLQFYTLSGMTSAEFAQIAGDITVSTNNYSGGLVNVNTASAPVLAAVFMGLGVDQNTAAGAAQTLLTYRQQNTGNLNSIAWLVDALGNTHTVVQTLAGARRDFLTTRAFQFTADIAAVGPFGRGYRRVKFVFDISEGAPKIVYRQDLSRLGWALGEKTRANWVTKETR
jgi:type II secretory pathway component PulK